MRDANNYFDVIMYNQIYIAEDFHIIQPTSQQKKKNNANKNQKLDFRNQLRVSSSGFSDS